MKTLTISVLLTLLLIVMAPSEEPIQEYKSVDLVLNKCEKNIKRAHDVAVVADIQQKETVDSLQKVIISLQKEKLFLKRNLKICNKNTFDIK